MAMVGDSVKYIPDEAHGLDIMPDGTTAWDYGTVNPKTKQVEKLTPDLLGNLLNIIRRDPERKSLLVPMGPAHAWPALILKLNDDGTADLGITSPLPGVALGYFKVPYDASGKTPGSWN